jgi:hypothetical protein
LRNAVEHDPTPAQLPAKAEIGMRDSGVDFVEQPP